MVELGIADVFARASEIKEIIDPSPLVTVGLHRLLLAILHRVIGPPSIGAWCDLWNKRKWDAGQISAYLAKWHHRFFLFDESHPFYQEVEMEDAEMHPISKIAHELASGNNATLFDHHNKGTTDAWAPSKAARYIVAYQAYAVAGGVSKPFNFVDGPLTRGLAVMVLATDLFETLALNLLVYNNEKPISSIAGDKPQWERDGRRDPDPAGTPVDGYLDYLTWQSRRIKLSKNEQGNCDKVQILQKHKLPDMILDPMKAFRKIDDGRFVPLRINADKAVWRDSHAILRISGEESIRPQVLTQLAELRKANKEKRVSLKFPPVVLSVAGVGYGASIAKIDLWRLERIPFDLDYVDKELLLGRLEECLDFTRRAGWTFGIGGEDDVRKMPFWILGEALLSVQGGTKAQKIEVTKIVDSLGAERIFWSRMAVPFFELMHGLATSADERYDTEVLPAWKGTLKSIAEGAFRTATKSLASSGRGLKGLTMAERAFKGMLNNVLETKNQ